MVEADLGHALSRAAQQSFDLSAQRRFGLRSLCWPKTTGPMLPGAAPLAATAALVLWGATWLRPFRAAQVQNPN